MRKKVKLTEGDQAVFKSAVERKLPVRIFFSKNQKKETLPQTKQPQLRVLLVSHASLVSVEKHVSCSVVSFHFLHTPFFTTQVVGVVGISVNFQRNLFVVPQG